ncbi:MAG: peptide chain release factor N(5)-glutamine methyltransferase [Chitinophagaceae bacterium]
MNFKEAKNYFLRHYLSQDLHEKEAIFYRWIEDWTQKSKLELLTGAAIDIGESKLDIIIERLNKNEPIQHILGYEWFGHLQIAVNSSVLIPRPETEELCQWVCKEAMQLAQTLNILDIGTGSACIPIYIKSKMPQSNVWALDYSQKALQVAQANIDRYDLDISLLHHDILDSTLTLSQSFDILISNPPYILPIEKELIANTVLDYEPHEALFVSNNDPMQFYKAIAHFSTKHLKPQGAVYVETHAEHAKEVLACFEDSFCIVEIRNDMYGKERFVKAMHKKNKLA